MSRRPQRLARILLAVMSPLLGAVGCSEPPLSGSVGEALELVITQVPAGSRQRGPAAAFDLEARYPEGSRVVLMRIGEAETGPRSLSGELVAAGAPAVSADAASLLFTARAKAGGDWAIYRADLERRKAPSRLTPRGMDCTDPAFLAGGRAVFTCAPRADGTASWALYTASLEGGELQRITFGPGAAFDPSQLPDGRVLFSMWQDPGSGRPDRATALFTVNADGTLLAAFAGHHGGATLKARGRWTHDAGIVYLAAETASVSSSVRRLELARPRTAPRPLALPIEPLTIESLPDGSYLLTGYPGDGSVGEQRLSGLYRWRPGEPTARLSAMPGWEPVEAVPRSAYPAPRNRPSAVERDRSTGIVLCYDAARSDGLIGPRATASARGIAVEIWDEAGPAALGGVPLDGDGSFHLEVPADRPLRVRTLDGGGATIALSDWFWVRPGEVRACFGCHENRDLAPVNRSVAALGHPPSRLGHGPQRSAR